MASPSSQRNNIVSKIKTNDDIAISITIKGATAILVFDST